MNLLEARGVKVVYEPASGQRIWSVRDVDIDLAEGEFVGLVGESGCGKSTLGYALTRMLRPPAKLESGSITFDGADIARMDDEQLRQFRHNGIALVLQSGMNALNPVASVEQHFRDVLRAHGKISKSAAAAKATEVLKKVRLEPTLLRRFPHELSGGMRQRVSIALVLALEPRLIVFDEPTTALDVVVQKAVMETIKELQAENGFTAVLISHDLGVVLDATDRVLVMYAGRIIEECASNQLVTGKHHPYTEALLGCYADPRAEEVHITGIPGTPPDLSLPVDGCAYAARCTLTEPICREKVPALLPLAGGTVACHVRTTQVEREAEASGVR